MLWFNGWGFKVDGVGKEEAEEEKEEKMEEEEVWEGGGLVWMEGGGLVWMEGEGEGVGVGVGGRGLEFLKLAWLVGGWAANIIIIKNDKEGNGR